jgi:hypothetical protein
MSYSEQWSRIGRSLFDRHSQGMSSREVFSDRRGAFRSHFGVYRV